MTNDSIKAQLLLLLARSKKDHRSLDQWRDWRLRQFAIRGRCSPVGRDEFVSRLSREVANQPLRQWRVK